MNHLLTHEKINVFFPIVRQLWGSLSRDSNVKNIVRIKPFWIDYFCVLAIIDSLTLGYRLLSLPRKWVFDISLKNYILSPKHKHLYILKRLRKLYWILYWRRELITDFMIICNLIIPLNTRVFILLLIGWMETRENYSQTNFSFEIKIIRLVIYYYFVKRRYELRFCG